MPFRVRRVDAECKFCHQLRLEALQRVIPRETIQAVLTAHHAHASRERKLTMLVVVWVVMAMHLYAQVAIGDLLAQLGHGLRLLLPEPVAPWPTASALTYRRYQLGARPLVALFHAICRPIATAQTRGAFLGGLRLMALDGNIKDVPDTPENEAAFGRWTGGRGASAFPQVQVVTLTECGTHVVVDGGLWPCQTNERVGARRLVRSLTAGMLVLLDRGLVSFGLLRAVRGRRAHVLGRVPRPWKFALVRRLPDGSALVWFAETSPRGKKTGRRCRVRLIEYTLTDPARPGCGERHRLITTLRNPERFPARDVVCAYHERWETELTIDEQETHLWLPKQPLRSRKPVGVIQEIYGMWLAHYAIRWLIHEAALAHDLDPDRLSFVQARRVIAAALSDFELLAPSQLPAQYARLLREIAAGRLPARRPRSYPRVVKRRISSFAVKRPEHRHPPRPQGAFRDTIRLI